MSWSRKRWLLPVSLLALLLATPATTARAQQAGAPTAQQRFDAAIDQAQKGQPGDAAAALVKLADDLPDDPFADDALSEAALLYEQTLRQPDVALRLLERVVTRYPQSRLVRRAQSRIDRLRVGLTTGQEPLIAYQAILGELPKLAPDVQVQKLGALLVKYPDFSLRDDVRMLRASAAARAAQYPLALQELAALENVESPLLRQRARMARAELLLDLGRLDEASALDSGPGFAKKLRVARARRSGWYGAIAVLALLWLAAIARLGRAGVRGLFVEPPLESLFFFPIGVLFVLAALTENRLITWATFWLALGGWIEVTLFAALLRHDAMRSTMRRALALVGLLLAIVALFLVVIEALGLFPLVVETLRHGPER